MWRVLAHAGQVLPVFAMAKDDDRDREDRERKDKKDKKKRRSASSESAERSREPGPQFIQALAKAFCRVSAQAHPLSVIHTLM